MAEVYKNNKRGWPRTKQQDELCQAMVIEGLSRADAGRKAGYAASTVHKKLHLIVKNLQPYIEYLRDAKAEVIQKNFEITVDRVVDELATIGFINPKDYIRVVTYRDVPMVIGKPVNELTDDQARAIVSWKREKVIIDSGYCFDYQYQFYDKRQSLRDMGAHLGMFNEKLILEQRITKIHKVDLSQVPDEILEHWMAELKKHSAVVEDQSGSAVIDHDTGAVT